MSTSARPDAPDCTDAPDRADAADCTADASRLDEAGRRTAAIETGPGLYVHVPFCEARCSYCDFYAVAEGDSVGHRYAEALEIEAQRMCPADFAPRTVSVGGGTPSTLDIEELRRVLTVCATIAAQGPGLDEWTIENNPGSLTPEKAAVMVEHGVTRLSLGVQSFDDAILRSVGRVHDSATAHEAVGIARASGVDQVSIDLLFAIPGQGIETFRRDLAAALTLGVDHVSAYALLYEPGTPMTRRLASGLVEREETDAELDMMRIAHDVLGDAGFSRYEVSNFARHNAECRHNLNYWRNGDYLGLGPSAVSFLDNERRANVADWREWERRVFAGDDAVVQTERLPPGRAAREEIMVRLRLAEGLDMTTLGTRWGSAARDDVVRLVEPYVRHGLLERQATGALRFTERGLEVSDGVLAAILAAE